MASKKKTIFNVGRRVYALPSGPLGPNESVELDESEANILLTRYPKDLKGPQEARDAGKTKRERDLELREKKLAEREAALEAKQKAE